ncbi:O-methyltransferase [Paenibacillus koleovorans]|uniref:O-methyltransferase n=1 Tax=Paenibacillus koleovorans TaxID=121608 RepID=UPI000FD7821A|nr:O-methyltransferase [Paenibacillus koleovorans]
MFNNSLARQLDIVFRQLRNELSQLSSGTVFIQIRNNIIGKFGIRHLPLETKDGKLVKQPVTGLSPQQQISFLRMAIDSLDYKSAWTHGEMFLDFSVRQSNLCASVQFESNYNMAHLPPADK